MDVLSEVRTIEVPIFAALRNKRLFRDIIQAYRSRLFLLCLGVLGVQIEYLTMGLNRSDLVVCIHNVMYVMYSMYVIKGVFAVVHV